MSAWLGIDTGGTFTDFVWFSPETGTVKLVKVPSDAAAPQHVCAEGLSRLDETLSQADRIVHGTTLVTNTVLEGTGADVATVTTKGYRDLIEIGRQSRSEMYSLLTKAVRPLSPRKWRIEAAERSLSDGTVVQAVQPADADALIDALERMPVTAVAVCFLFSYLAPENEARVASALRSRQWFVTASHEVVAQAREYERFSTTVLNAYVGPKASRYLDGLEDFISQRGSSTRSAFLIGSTGGAMTWDQAHRTPVSMLNSGPAGGVRGAVQIAAHTHYRNIITYDMGGTSTDVCLIRDLQPTTTSEGYLDNRPFLVPKLDIATIGAGGGSVAWIDIGGELQVGPRSAGATPGPACYGRGGDQPTVTDADVVLGRIPDGVMLGDSVRVRRDLAAAAVESISNAFPGMSVEAASEGIVKIAVAKMNTAIREVSVGRGVDPRDFALFAFGGAGPMHAVEVARTLSIGTVLIPPAPGLFSAFGLLTCDVRFDLVHSRFIEVSKLTAAEYASIFARMEKEARSRLATDGFAAEKIVFERSADIRYKGQWFELNLPVPPTGEVALAEIDSRFRKAHLQRYQVDMNRPTEFVNFRVAAIGVTEKARLEPGRDTAAGETPQTRLLVFDGRHHDTAVYPRGSLTAGQAIGGPAVIEETGATTIIPPGCAAEVLESGTLAIAVG